MFDPIANTDPMFQTSKKEESMA